jgi:hypothetical protein
MNKYNYASLCFIYDPGHASLGPLYSLPLGASPQTDPPPLPKLTPLGPSYSPYSLSSVRAPRGKLDYPTPGAYDSLR